MSKPTYLDLALKEWKALKTELRDLYCEVLTTGDDEHETTYYSPEFIYFVLSENNLDLRNILPAHPDSIDSVLRESKVLAELVESVQDYDSEFMQKFDKLPRDAFDSDVLDEIIKDLYGAY